MSGPFVVSVGPVTVSLDEDGPFVSVQVAIPGHGRVVDFICTRDELSVGQSAGMCRMRGSEFIVYLNDQAATAIADHLGVEYA